MSEDHVMGSLHRLVYSFCLMVILGGAGHAQSTADEKLAPAEREAIRQLIRQELKAEQETQPTQKKDDGQASSALVGHFANGFRWRTEDRSCAFHLGGRLEWDNGWFTQDENLLLGPAAGTRFQDGTTMRRARLRADGTIGEQMDFVCEINFANIQDVPNVNNESVQVGSVGLTDFHLTFRELPFVGNVRVGHFVAPYGLERFTSANYFVYMERSSIFDTFWGPNQRQSGVMVFDSYLEDRLTFHAAFTRVGRADLNSFAFTAEDGRYAGGVRITGLPVYHDERLLVHLGANYYHQAFERNRFAFANRLPLRAGAGRVQVPNVLATDSGFTPNGGNVVDLEWAMIHGPISLSAECAVAWVSDVFEQSDGVRNIGPRGNVTLWAFYIEGGYFLTAGDHRRYDRKQGTWDRMVPVENAIGARDDEGHWGVGQGAVELLARLSYVDLVGGSPPLTPASPTAGARAGRQLDVTLGLNWYLNPQTRLMLNYVWTHVDSVVEGASGDIQAIGTRLHFDF